MPQASAKAVVLPNPRSSPPAAPGEGRLLRIRIAFVACLLPLISACEQLGLETPAVVAAREEAEGRAIGSACRHAGRAIEDCYVLNPDAARAAIFAGWREMNDYMRENQINAVVPTIAPNDRSSKRDTPAAKKPANADAGGQSAPAKPPIDKVAEKKP